ncbi:hypothetical protein J1605_021845 [Eschrichtius robustus]|uniref:Protein FRA10AC1 n=1 Tax=Eschrichtius robustus TaxID=9764 RepID=A0AB34HAW5_ESCRO|nr:hypothetical protein J1605_021845 [Eschrichtius robustus]
MHGHGGYDSDFSDDEHCGESSKRKKKTVEDDLLLKKPFQKEKHGKVVHKQVAAELLDREEARNRRFHLIAMDAYQRHTKFVNDYILYYGGKKEDFRRLGENDKIDMDVIRENHRFLWNEEDEMDMNWEKRLAKKYYDKLFKEYCVADLTRYKENKLSAGTCNSDAACHLVHAPTKITVVGTAFGVWFLCGSTEFAKPSVAGAMSHCKHADNEAAMAEALSFLCTPPVLAQATLLALQAVSTQPNQVLSPGLQASSCALLSSL